jgi:hypothetical protein
MATLDWPAQRWATPATMRWSVQSQGAAWSAAYTGQAQRISHLADRWRVTMTLPVARAEQAGAREAFLSALARSGDWVRLWHFARPVPLGTLRGNPTASAASRGATSLTVNTTPGATLLAGDMLGVGGQLVQAASNATANGSGVAVVPLVMPLRLTVTNGTAVVWNQPTGTFQLVGGFVAEYVAPRVQLGPEISLLEVF